jgi:hypothetical protein
MRMILYTNTYTNECPMLAFEWLSALEVCPPKPFVHISQVACCCEYGNEPTGSVKCGECCDQLRNC